MQADPATLPKFPRAARKFASDHLREALLTLGGQHPRIASHRETAWASITFGGTRHRLELLFEGVEAVAAGEAFIEALPDHEFDIRGQLVADAAVSEVDHRLVPEPRMAIAVELLLLEDA